MRAFIRDQKYNFVDDNNRFVSFDSSHHCCESFGWFIAPEVCKDVLNPPVMSLEPAQLDGFNFDPSFFESINHRDLDHGGAAVFRLVHADGRQAFLHIWNKPHGYYSHGFEFLEADKTILKEVWAVMKAFSWDSLAVMGRPLQAPDGGPQRFIPVFDERCQAEAWAGPGYPMIELEPRTTRDWEADLLDENGKYQNKCEQCGETFIGYSGRAICFACYKKG